MLINKLLLKRIENREDRCIGKLFINYKDTDPNDWRFFGYVVEDPDRGLDASMSISEILRHKIKGRTAIPTGEYPIEFTWSPKYNRIMLEVRNVPGYAGIRIHPGNGPEDTEGCICPGLEFDKETGRTGRSRSAVAWLEDRILEAHQSGCRISLRIEKHF